MISPSNSDVTLTHTETDVAPECRVVFGAGRLQSDSKIDSRVVALTFAECSHARVSPKADNAGLGSEGFEFLEDAPKGIAYRNWISEEWKRRGYCPSSGFWVVARSSWLSELRASDGYHYVICGRDGYVELIAKHYSWQEWEWCAGHRDDAVRTNPIASGTGYGNGA
jgi:hypothetical protein